MPDVIDSSMDALQTASNYKFSATRIENLGAPEYTLATSVCDASGSVMDFKDDLEKCLKTVAESCQKSPRAENLMYRVAAFNNGVYEVHGFKLLSDINPGDYDDCINPSGMTALFDATHTAIEATKDYGKILVDQDFAVNAVIFIITDGFENASSVGINSIKDVIRQTQHDECLESLTTVLIGVGNEPNLVDELKAFKDDGGLNQFIAIGEATPAKLAKLASFISRSISSTSQALGSGQASALLTF